MSDDFMVELNVESSGSSLFRQIWPHGIAYTNRVTRDWLEVASPSRDALILLA